MRSVAKGLRALGVEFDLILFSPYVRAAETAEILADVLKVKKDAPDQSIVVQGVPSIDKKEAISEVLIKDGGVVAIAGIYSIRKAM